MLAALLPGGLTGEARMRASLLAYGIALLGGVIILWLPIELAIGSPAAAAGMSVLVLSLLIAAVLLRRGAAGAAVHVVLTVYALVTSVTTLMGGGAGLENLLAVVLLPILAGALSRGRATLLTWTAISLALVAAYWGLYAAGLARPASPQADTIGFVTLLFFIPMATLMAALFDQLRAKALADVRELNAALTVQRDRAQAASAAKSEFLTIMSHELRTPLSSVLGAANLLAEDPGPAQRTEYLEVVRSSASALLAQLNVVLDYTSLDQELALEPQPTDVLALCKALARAHAPIASRRGVALTLRADGLDGPVQIDGVYLRQVVHNLLANAVKFTPRGEITVRARVRDGTLCVEVEDTGIGIPAERLEEIFQPFTQLDATFSRQFEGIGLGLPLSQRIARQMGGTLTVDSTPGQGSRFQLTLPAPPAASQPTAPAVRQPAAAGQPFAVLLVEDNPINQLVAERLLAAVGCTVWSARDGAEAVLQAATRRFDLILMDCMMPVVDGYEATRQIRGGGGPSAASPIVALTANALVSDRRRSLAIGMDDHIPKPLTRAEVLALLERYHTAEVVRAGSRG